MWRPDLSAKPEHVANNLDIPAPNADGTLMSQDSFLPCCPLFLSTLAVAMRIAQPPEESIA